MLNLVGCNPAQLQLVDNVCGELLAKSAHLHASDIMVVGANCRDILQDALGHGFDLRATQDVDIALAIADWVSYRDVVDGLPRVGGTGIRYRVAEVPADLVPFGPVEDPTGVIIPAPRKEEMSVWAFQEVFDGAMDLPLPTAGTIRVPTVPGYAALKLAAWLDRCARGEYKDATDIATTLYWYMNSEAIADRLYATDYGQEVLVPLDVDPDRGAAQLLGEDIATTIGPARVAELVDRWPGPLNYLLPEEMKISARPAGWTHDLDRRQQLLQDMERGWTAAP